MASTDQSRSDSDMASDSAAGSVEAARSADQSTFNVDDIPVEVLVGHLLDAKRSLSSITHVVRANDLAMHARQLHEESVVLSSQTSFMRRGIDEQLNILDKIRQKLLRTYDEGRQQFKQLLLTLDATNERLEATRGVLKNTVVDDIFKSPGEESAQCLADFVDSRPVRELIDALKDCVNALSEAQQSFDGDLLRLDDEARMIRKAMKAEESSAAPSPDASDYEPMAMLLMNFADHARSMAENLASLTRHFDMCVKAVKCTEGGVALARRRAAEQTESGGEMSLSDVMANELKPIDTAERNEIVQLVMQDATEVPAVVEDIQAAFQKIEADFATLKQQADRVRADNSAVRKTFVLLEDVGTRLRSYVMADAEYRQRCENEKDIVYSKLKEMDTLREFYEQYASAYDTMLLEAERRRTVEDKIQNVARKAMDNIKNLLEADRKQREHFVQEVGDYLPTDLAHWTKMAPREWRLVVVEPGSGEGGSRDVEPPTPTLASVAEAVSAKAKGKQVAR